MRIVFVDARQVQKVVFLRVRFNMFRSVSLSGRRVRSLRLSLFSTSLFLAITGLRSLIFSDIFWYFDGQPIILSMNNHYMFWCLVWCHVLDILMVKDGDGFCWGESTMSPQRVASPSKKGRTQWAQQMRSGKTSAWSQLLWLCPRSKPNVKVGWEWLRMAENGWEWLRMAENGWEWLRMAENGWEWLRMAENGWEWLRMAENGWEWLRAKEKGTSETKEKKYEKMLETGEVKTVENANISVCCSLSSLSP